MIDTMKQALEALKDATGFTGSRQIDAKLNQAITALRAAIEAAEKQEPVFAFRRKGLGDFCTCTEERYNELAQKPRLFEVKVFYTALVPQVPAGMVLVPKEPTEEMCAVLNEMLTNCHSVEESYADLIAAAQKGE